MDSDDPFCIKVACCFFYVSVKAQCPIHNMGCEFHQCLRRQTLANVIALLAVGSAQL